jgi:prophage regulatory protein
VDAVDPDRLMGAYEIRVRLGDLSETRGRQITMRPDFPRPVKVLAMGQIWDGAQVEAWIAEHRTVKDDDEA